MGGRGDILRPWMVGIVGSVLGAAFLVQAVVGSDGDPTVFLNVGVDNRDIIEFANSQLGSVSLIPEAGHDGKFFFIQATDPWITEPGIYLRLLDRPTYRAGRVAYPALAGGFGAFPVAWLPWSLAITNVLAMGLGTWATSRLAVHHGLTPLYGVAFLANPGVFNEFFISGSGVLALALALAGLVASEHGRWKIAATVLAFAVLAREVMMLWVLGAAAWWWRNGQKRTGLAVVSVSATVWSAWMAWVWFRLGSDSSAAASIGVPFVGIAQASRGWLAAPGVDLLVSGLLVAAGLLIAVKAVRAPGLLTWSAAGFVIMAPILTRPIWQRYFDSTRALSPLFTVAVLLLALAVRERTSSGRGTVMASHTQDGDDRRTLRHER